jgi:hypothetical protein
MMENILPELSHFYCHPGNAGGSPRALRPDLRSSVGHQYPNERFGSKPLLDALAIIFSMAIEVDVQKEFHV